jgi:hypothetical protein
MHRCGKKTKDKTVRTSRQELTLSSALSDPLVRTLMAADKVDPVQLQSMLSGIAGRLTPGKSPAGEAGCMFAW